MFQPLHLDDRRVAFRACGDGLLLGDVRFVRDRREFGSSRRQRQLGALRLVPQRSNFVVVSILLERGRAADRGGRVHHRGELLDVAVHHRFVSNVSRPRRVLERVERFFEVGIRGRYARDHARAGVAAERILQQPGELGVAVRDVQVPRSEVLLPPLLVVRYGVDHVAQGEQAAVDVDGLLKPVPRRARALVSLRTRQVHQVKLRRAERPAVPPPRLPRQVPLLQYHREYRVRPRGLLVHLRPARGSAHRAVLQQADHLLSAASLAFADAAHDDGAVRAFPHADLLRRDVRVQQIPHLLVVNLEERASHRALARAPPLVNPGEDVPDDARYDANLVVAAGVRRHGAHRVRLAAARLPVRQHRRVVPVEARVHQGRDQVIVHPACSESGPKTSSKWNARFLPRTTVVGDG